MKQALDRIDFGILDALQRNARLSNKELAARVGLAPSSCLERMRKLERGGILRGYGAEVNPSAYGIGLQALMFIRLKDLHHQVVESYRDHLLTIPEVLSVFLISGEHDYLAHLAVRDADHLRRVGLEKITVRPEVGHVETILIFEHTRNPGLPRPPEEGSPLAG